MRITSHKFYIDLYFLNPMYAVVNSCLLSWSSPCFLLFLPCLVKTFIEQSLHIWFLFRCFRCLVSSSGLSTDVPFFSKQNLYTGRFQLLFEELKIHGTDSDNKLFSQEAERRSGCNESHAGWEFSRDPDVLIGSQDADCNTRLRDIDHQNSQINCYDMIFVQWRFFISKCWLWISSFPLMLIKLTLPLKYILYCICAFI